MKNAAETLFKTLIHFLQNTLGNWWPLAAAALIAAALFAITAYWSIPALARLTERAKRHVGRHLLPRPLLKELDALLANEAVMSTYAPAQRFITQLREDEKMPKINAWMSAFPRAVKAAVVNENNRSLNQFHDARKQVRTAAKRVKIRPMDDDEKVEWLTDEEDPYGLFIIELSHDGMKSSKILGLMENVQTQLMLADIREIQKKKSNGNGWRRKKKWSGATILCSKNIKIEDRLTTMKRGKEWLDENPARNVKSFPIAFTVREQVFALPTHHTLVFGSTGSGKSGPFLNAIYQLSPFADKGIVQFYGIDPKYADLRVFEGSDLFPKMAHTVEESIELINYINQLLNDRSAGTKADLKNGKTGRTNDATKETPWIFFFVDEIVVLRNQLDAEGPAGKAAWKNFQNIMMMGRARGIFLFVATQDATREVLDKLRPNFGNTMVLAQESDYLNKLFLGETAAENGYDSTAIEQSTPSNGYKTSGIAFVKGETGEPMKVRMAYLSEEDLAAFALEHGADPNQEGSLTDDDFKALDLGKHPVDDLEETDLDSLPDWAVSTDDGGFDWEDELPPLD